jgi:hypothetical protein
MPTTESFEKLVAPGVVRRTDRGLCLAGRRITFTSSWITFKRDGLRI